MKVLVWFIVLDFLFIFMAIVYILTLEIYTAVKHLQKERQDKKDLFIKRLTGKKEYEIVETVHKGVRTRVERRIRV